MSLFRRRVKEEASPTLAVPKDQENLQWLVSEARGEYEFRLRTFESLDMKLGVLIAFIGVMIAFPHRIPVWYHIAGFSLALSAGALAILGFWPKRVLLIDSLELFDKYGTANVETLRSQTLGNLQNAVKDLKEKNKSKSDKLNWAGILAAMATLSYGFGAFQNVKGG